MEDRPEIWLVTSTIGDFTMEVTEFDYLEVQRVYGFGEYVPGGVVRVEGDRDGRDPIIYSVQRYVRGD